MASLCHIDVDSAQLSHHNYYCCGDSFLTHRVQEESRVVSILSDGLGSGAIASVLSSLTASMALRFAIAKQGVEYIAQTIMDTLPIDPRKGLSYATFIIADVERNGLAHIIEFDNPPVLLVRNGEAKPLDYETKTVTTAEGHERQMRVAKLQLQVNDRLILVSDGVTQSGMGRSTMPFGYGLNRLARFAAKAVQYDPDISSHSLSEGIIHKAKINDLLQAKDDITCGVIHFRKPRRLLICTGPPFSEDKDQRMADYVRHFEGQKVVAGGTTAQILARLWSVPLQVILSKHNDGLPPCSALPGADLCTEGVITLSRVATILRSGRTKIRGGKGPAWAIVDRLLDSDTIEFLVGTRLNMSHYDPDLPVELAARRTLVREIADSLREDYTKEVTIEYI